MLQLRTSCTQRIFSTHNLTKPWGLPAHPWGLQTCPFLFYGCMTDDYKHTGLKHYHSVSPSSAGRGLGRLRLVLCSGSHKAPVKVLAGRGLGLEALLRQDPSTKPAPNCPKDLLL